MFSGAPSMLSVQVVLCQIDPFFRELNQNMTTKFSGIYLNRTSDCHTITTALRKLIILEQFVLNFQVYEHSLWIEKKIQVLNLESQPQMYFDLYELKRPL